MFILLVFPEQTQIESDDKKKNHGKTKKPTDHIKKFLSKTIANSTKVLIEFNNT